MTTTKKTSTRKASTAKVSVKIFYQFKSSQNPFAFEIFHLVSKQRSKAKKIEILKKYEQPWVKSLLIWNFDESIVSMLPEGEVPYSGFEDQATYSGTLSTKIDEEIRKMHETGSFSLGSGDKQGHTTIRREAKFLPFCERWK